MAVSESLSMTRRCFFTAAGLAVAAPAAIAARESATETRDAPEAVLLGEGEPKTYLLVFHTGQEVMKGLHAFAKQQGLVAGHLTGIGAISHAVLGYFNPQKKAYERVRVAEQTEVLALTGNLALYDNEPFFEVHTALGLENGSARGGHLFEAYVRPTVEVVLTAFAHPVRRKIDPATGLPLLAP